MKEPKRAYKTERNFKITLNEEQKEAKRLIMDNQITIITGRAGSGKSLVAAQTALDFLQKEMIDNILVTRGTVEVGKTLGYLPGGLDQKFDPYIEALVENLSKCIDPKEVEKFIEDGQIKAMPVQFIRGKTIEDILIVEEGQNLTRLEMIAILTRLGKTGKIVITGDQAQRDTMDVVTGLDFAIDLAKMKLEGIAHIKLKENHRSDLVGQILDLIYDKKI